MAVSVQIVVIDTLIVPHVRM